MKVDMGVVSLEVPLTFTGDHQAPDRVQGVVATTLLGFSIKFEYVTIGDTTYRKNPMTGEWETAEQWIPFNIEYFAGDNPSEIVEALEFVGTESLEGARVYHLKGTLPSQVLDESGGELETEYWIGVKDGRIRTIAFQGELRSDSGLFPATGPQSTAATLVNVTGTMKLSDYAKPGSIEAPK